MTQVRGLGPRVGGRLYVLRSSREPGVRRPCSDFMDMLRRLIYCRIIIIIIIVIIIKAKIERKYRRYTDVNDCSQFVL